MLLYKYKLKLFIFFIRTIYINYKGPEKNSLSLEAYLDLSWFRYDTYIHKIWDKDLDLNLNNFFSFYKFIKKIKELFNLSLNLLYKFKFTLIIFLKLYKILYNLIQNIKYYNFINRFDNLDVQIEQILLINPIINKKLILLTNQLNNFKDIISKIKIINLKQIKLILKQFLLKHQSILYIFYNKILHLEVFDYIELCSKIFFFVSIINDMLNFLYLSIFKNRINILNYNSYNHPYYNYIYYVYDFYNALFTIYNIIYKLFFIKLNIISTINKLLINTIIFFQTCLLININFFFSFKESKLELLSIILFLELFFLCCSFIAVVDINFDNFYLKCLNFIKLNNFELLNLLEFMFINILKKKYFFFNIYISNLIKKFLTDINLFKLYLIKYYNLKFIKIIKSVYLKSYILTIKVLMSLYNFNLSLNILNDSFEFIKLVRSLNLSKLKNINYLFNLFYNLSYYFDSIILNLNYIFLISLKQYEKKLVVSLENNLDLIKPTPYKNQISMEELAEQVQLKMLKSKRSKPRNLTIYQTNSLIELGVLEPKKNLTKKELYQDEWGVSWEFAQDNKDYMLDVSNYILRRNLRRQTRLINNKSIKKKSLRGKPSKIKIKIESKYDMYYLHNQKALDINLSLLSIQDFNMFLYFKIIHNFKIYNSYHNKSLVKIYKLRKYKKKCINI